MKRIEHSILGLHKDTFPLRTKKFQMLLELTRLETRDARQNARFPAPRAVQLIKLCHYANVDNEKKFLKATLSVPDLSVVSVLIF